MKKSIKALIIIMLICIIVSGCSKNKDPQHNPVDGTVQGGNENRPQLIAEKDYITDTSPYNDEDYLLRTMKGAWGHVAGIVCNKNNIVYFVYENDGAAATYYRYNLNEGETYKLGTIENPYINSGDVAINGDNIYLYHNTVSLDSSGNEEVRLSLYEINLADSTLNKLTEEAIYQTLVYLDFEDNKVISFKGKMDGENGISYLDIYDTEKPNTEFETLISKTFNNATRTGEEIYNFAESCGTLYVFVCTYDKGTAVSLNIEMYDLEGNKTGNIEVDEETANILYTERISKIQVIDNYIFFRTFSGGGIFADISSGKTEPKLIREFDLDIAVSAPENTQSIFLYSREDGTIWQLDTQNKKLVEIDVPFDRLNTLYVDEKNNLLITIPPDEIIPGEKNYITLLYTDSDKLPKGMEIKI